MTPNHHAEWKKRALSATRRVVIKIGSSLVSDHRGIKRDRIGSLSREVAALHDSGRQTIVVTSGAVAAGMARLGSRERPTTIPQRQAAAAVGQIDLMALYEEHFARAGKRVAQVLLTHDDLANRRRYINAKHTVESLLQARVIPIANENDTVAIEELNFGDNDNLSALVATLVEADLLIILSDVAGVFDKDPRHHPDAVLLPLLRGDEDLQVSDTGRTRSSLGTGGMTAKLAAAHKASSAGIPSVIADGQHAGTLARIFDTEAQVGTLILPAGDRLAHRKHWIAYTLRPIGSIVVDDGAQDALRSQGRSLLSTGILEVDGEFEPGDCVRCMTRDGVEFARGLVNYSASDVRRIMGMRSNRIEAILGYRISDEVIHRDDLALLGRHK